MFFKRNLYIIYTHTRSIDKIKVPSSKVNQSLSVYVPYYPVKHNQFSRTKKTLDDTLKHNIMEKCLQKSLQETRHIHTYSLCLELKIHLCEVKSECPILPVKKLSAIFLLNPQYLRSNSNVSVMLGKK